MNVTRLFLSDLRSPSCPLAYTHSAHSTHSAHNFQQSPTLLCSTGALLRQLLAASALRHVVRALTVLRVFAERAPR